MMYERQTKKQVTRFTLIFLGSLALIFLWIFPLTGAYFDFIDNKIFYFLNSTLKKGDSWQLFWAVTNVRIFDAVAGLFVLIMLLVHAYTEEKHTGWKTALPRKKIITFVLFIAVTIIVNKLFFSMALELFDYHRKSPSLVLDGAVRLSEIVTSFEFKDASKDCFPGDHAAVLLCSTVYFFIYGTKRTGILSAFLLLPFILPRLVVGAHWFTDCLVGSTFILINSLNIWINFPLIREKTLTLIFNKMTG